MNTEIVPDPQPQQPDLPHIRRLIASHFSLQELKTLCFDVGIEFDDLEGTSRSEKARELIPYSQRHGRLPDLLQTLAAERPGIAWPGGAAPDIHCPYRGLFAFREADAANFFGREDVADRLAETIAQQSLLAVVGPSGSGKSSVVFAGLLPQLRQQGRWLTADFRPGVDSFLALATALIPHLEPDLSKTDRLIEARKQAVALQNGDLTLNDVINGILQEQAAGTRFLLIADQFEELYTLCPDTEIRHQFLDVILRAEGRNRKAEGDFRPPPSAFCLVLTLRADFMGQALAYPPLVEALQDNDLKLGPMPPDALRRAIEAPAHRAGAGFEAGLVERILDDVGTEGSNLPLLEFALTLLWEWQTGQRQLTHAAYEQIGQVKGALASHADQVLEGLNPAEQAQAQRIFVQMVHPGAGTEDTRRLARREELGDADWTQVQRLADARLLVTDQDETGQETVEVIHEALIQRWGQLRGWMASDRDFRVWQERLRAALRQWESNNRDAGSLWRGVSLENAENWMRRRDGDLSSTENEFIQKSLDLRSRNKRLQKQVYVLVAFMLLIVTGLAIIAMTKSLESRYAAATSEAVAADLGTSVVFAQEESTRAFANESTAIAERTTAEATGTTIAQQQATTVAMATMSAVQQGEIYRQESFTDARILASESIRLADRDPVLSFIKAYQAADIVYSNEKVLTEAAYTALYGVLAKVERQGILIGHKLPIHSAVYSPDGAYILTASKETNARLWSSSGVPLAVLEGHVEAINSVTFSPDGTRILTASDDFTARIWDLAGDPIGILEGHTEAIHSAIFAPDGESILTFG